MIYNWLTGDGKYLVTPIMTNTDKDVSSQNLLEMIRCSTCKTGCSTRRCSCCKAGLDCSEVCGECRGICTTNMAALSDGTDSLFDNDISEQW